MQQLRVRKVYTRVNLSRLFRQVILQKGKEKKGKGKIGRRGKQESNDAIESGHHEENATQDTMGKGTRGKSLSTDKLQLCPPPPPPSPSPPASLALCQPHIAFFHLHLPTCLSLAAQRPETQHKRNSTQQNQNDTVTSQEHF